MTFPPANDFKLEVLRLQSIIDSSSDCIKVLDLDGRLLSMNAGGLETMEIRDFQECQSALWPTFWEGEARQDVERAVEAARAGRTTTFEGPANTFAGTPRWWEVRVSPIRGQDGTVTQLLSISRDVTARKTAELKLKESERQLRDQASLLKRQVSRNALALEAFVRFTTVVASSTDLTVLATAATEILRDAVGGAISGFYLVRGDRAYPLVFSENTPQDVALARRAGVPLDAPLVAEALGQRETAFAEGPQGRAQSVGYASALSVTAYRRQGQPYALLATGTAQPHWTDQERAITESVGQGLGLALDRVHQNQQLQERTAGLDAFVSFTEMSGTVSDVLDLARRAAEVLHSTLGDVSVVYYEREQHCWTGQIWSGNVSPAAQAQLRAGIPLDAPGFAEAVQAGTAVFADGQGAEGVHLPGAAPTGAAAVVPILVVGEVPRLLAVGKVHSVTWTEREQAVLRAVGRGLGLALERTELARQLTRQRDSLEERTRDLEAANEELEAFTYSASHDLRTPIRHVMGFAELTQLALLETPNPQANERLEVVKQAALRMSAMIDGMLALSRSGRTELHVGRVDLAALVTQARRDAAAEFATHPVHWQIDQLPTVWGDYNLLQQVMTNLMSNAVKYSSTRTASEIRVWTQEDEHAWTVSVGDNGVGFDPRYAQKLFGIFQRLHTERQFKGTGIGLATVRRIVVKHGGQVSAESTLETGATFSFTLPKPRTG